MKRLPALCPSGEGVFATLAEGIAHYVEHGLSPFDASSDWQLMRDDAWQFEAFIRPDGGQWRGTVAQLAR